jgi:hypothetical protein
MVVKRERSWVNVAAVPMIVFIMLGAFVFTANPCAAAKNVTVTIQRAVQIDPVDSTNQADFFWYVTLDGDRRACSPHPWAVNDNDISPYWSTTFYNKASGSGQTYTLTIELWDCDCGSSAEDLCDISKVDGYGGSASIATMVYHIDSNTWSGDDTGDGYVSGEESPDSSTGSDEDDCALWFMVSN